MYENGESDPHPLTALLESTPDYVFAMDSDGIVRYLNPAARSLLPGGLPPEGAALDVIQPAWAARRVREVGLPAALRDGAWKGETELRNASGEEIPVSQVLVACRQPRGGLQRIYSIARDISDLREKEAALHAFYQQIVSILESITDGFFSLDLDWRFSYVNKEAARLFRTSREELLGRSLWESLPQLSRNRFHQEFERALLENVPVHFGDYLPSLDGWYEIHAYPLDSGLSVYFRNVSDRINTFNALRHSEDRYRSLFERMAEGFLLVEDRGEGPAPEGGLCLLAANPAAGRILGIRPQEVVGRCVRDLVPPLSEKWIERLQEVLHSGKTSLFREYLELTDRFVELHLFRSAPQQCACIFTDRTAEERARRGRLEAEQRFRLVAENHSDIILIYSLDRRIRFINAAGAALCGRARKNVIGRRDEEVLPAAVADQCLPALKRSIENRQIQRVEVCLDRPDGRLWAAIFTYVPMLSKRGEITYVLAVTQDITERRRGERQLIELNESLERRVAERTREVERQADQLRRLATELTQAEQHERRRLAKILHDHLQQLLVAAKIQAESLQQPDSGSPTVRRKSRRLHEYLTEAMRVSRSLSVELSPPVLHDAGLVLALDWLARNLQERYGLKVCLRLDPQAEPESEIARTTIFESVRELLLNVVKHAGVLEAELSLAARPDGQIELTVTDRGAGFDIRRLEASDASAGFGLFSIRQRLEIAGGSFTVETTPGVGTLIRLAIPRTAFLDRQQHPPSPPAETEEPPNSRKRQPAAAGRTIGVLIADDHRIFREGLTGVLESCPDIRVVGEAEDGDQAVRLARQLEPDVVIMDISMPRMNGIEATRRLVSEQPQVKVIGLSMHEEDDVARAMKDAGAVTYLTKDGPSENLLQAIRTCSNPAGGAIDSRGSDVCGSA